MSRQLRWFLVAAAVAAVSTVLPADVSAGQRAVRRPAPRSVVYVRARPYYRPVYYSPFLFSAYAGWYGGWYPYGWHSPYPYRYPYRPYGYAGSARLQVKPRHAEVFVDGYFVGMVDDFDGWSQRLDLEPGEHEIEIYLAGHRTYRQQVLFRPGATVRIEHAMQPLAAGEPEEARPSSAAAAARPPAPARRSLPPEPEERPARTVVPETQSGAYGTVSVRVQPRDAQVLVDGEAWDAPDAGTIILQLADGLHRVEIRRSGYRPYSTDLRVRRGETTTLNVSLSRE